MKLTENQIRRIVRKVISEQLNMPTNALRFTDLNPQEVQDFFGQGIDRAMDYGDIEEEHEYPLNVGEAFATKDEMPSPVLRRFEQRAAEEYRSVFGEGPYAHSSIMKDLILNGIPRHDAEEFAYGIINGDY